MSDGSVSTVKLTALYLTTPDVRRILAENAAAAGLTVDEYVRQQIATNLPDTWQTTDILVQESSSSGDVVEEPFIAVGKFRLSPAAYKDLQGLANKAGLSVEEYAEKNLWQTSSFIPPKEAQALRNYAQRRGISVKEAVAEILANEDKIDQLLGISTEDPDPE